MMKKMLISRRSREEVVGNLQTLQSTEDAYLIKITRIVFECLFERERERERERLEFAEAGKAARFQAFGDFS